VQADCQTRLSPKFLAVEEDYEYVRTQPPHDDCRGCGKMPPKRHGERFARVDWNVRESYIEAKDLTSSGMVVPDNQIAEPRDTDDKRGT
jgi:hypothetical protein